ncbi:hypothetical protein EMCRGX_G016589 [Ephydatia muelleri]
MSSGYNHKFLCPLLKRHECPICLLAMRDPVQTECGHLFCRGCLEPVLATPHPVCPIDKSDISANRAHLTQCKYRTAVCRLCGIYFPLYSLIDHQDKECPMRPEVCQYCKREVPVTQLQTHIERVCPEYLHPCPNGCIDIILKLPELEAHLDLRTGDCPLAEVYCPYKLYGCRFVTQRHHLSTHLDKYGIQHVHMQADCWTQLMNQTNRTTIDIGHISERVSQLDGRMTSVEGHLNALQERVESLINKSTIIVTSPEIALIQGQIVNLQRTIEGLQRLTDVNIKGNEATLATPASRIADVNGAKIDTLHTKVSELDHGLDRCLSSCLDQELRLQLLERATYNGVYLWKIDDFARRTKEAVDGVTMSLYSIPFYTSRHGYKMCAKVYLNGDGMGKGTHLSFFFVVMKGPFDALLPWPFKQKVTLTIINQAGKKHVTDTFHPDPQSNSFQRPTQKEMNVALGCPMFIHQEQLVSEGFVKDDCIFLRAAIDTSNLSESLLL